MSHSCRWESISPALHYQWSKAFLEAGKNGLTVDTKRYATKAETQGVREENEALKKALAETILEIKAQSSPGVQVLAWAEPQSSFANRVFTTSS